ncbi:hypothetical protein Tco_0814554 [Tanacetum coccineum]
MPTQCDMYFDRKGKPTQCDVYLDRKGTPTQCDEFMDRRGTPIRDGMEGYAYPMLVWCILGEHSEVKDVKMCGYTNISIAEGTEDFCILRTKSAKASIKDRLFSKEARTWLEHSFKVVLSLDGELRMVCIVCCLYKIGWLWRARTSLERCMKGVRGSVIIGGDKVVTWCASWLGGDKYVMKVVSKFFKKLKCVCHWTDPFKDLKWSNVSGVKLSSLSESDDTFLSLQALSDLYYLFGGFMDYLWSRELDISNFGPADRLKAYLQYLDGSFTLSIRLRDICSTQSKLRTPKHSALTPELDVNDCHDLI